MRVENLYATTGFVSRAFHIVGGQWLGKTSPRPTPTHLLAARAPVHEDGATVTHHTYNTNGVMEETVGHGPASSNEVYLPVRANVTRRHADTCAAPITVVVVTAKKMIIARQSTRTLTVSSGLSRGTSGGNGAVPQ